MVRTIKRDGDNSTLPSPKLSPGAMAGNPPPIGFPAGNDEFRAVRNHCARACRRFNEIPEDAEMSTRVAAWLE